MSEKEIVKMSPQPSVPYYPGISMRATVCPSDDFKTFEQHIMLESMVNTDAGILVLCSERYRLDIGDSDYLMDHLDGFHREFNKYCLEVKLDYTKVNSK